MYPPQQPPPYPPYPQQPYPQQQGYGPPPGGYPPPQGGPPAPKKSNAGVFIAIGLVLFIPLVLTGLVFGLKYKKRIDMEESCRNYCAESGHCYADEYAISCV